MEIIDIHISIPIWISPKRVVKSFQYIRGFGGLSYIRSFAMWRYDTEAPSQLVQLSLCEANPPINDGFPITFASNKAPW